RPDSPSATEEALQCREEARASLDPGAEASRQGAADLLHARMHELGRVDDLALGRSDLLPNASEAAAARLQLGDPNHIVLGHGTRDLLRRGTGQRIVGSRALRLDPGKALQEIEIVAPVLEILKINDTGEPGRDHAMRGFRQLTRPLDQRVEADIADG